MSRYLTIGIAGHVDHGKTTLIRCLTGIDTDRSPEEKLRGLSIDAGIAPLEIPARNPIALVDVPGHTDYLKNTIRGLHAVDGAILVVAADDGIMPQTIEHLEVLKFFQVARGFVVLSKTDLVDPETLEIALLEIEEALMGTFLEGCPIVPFSAMDQKGGEAIRRRMVDMADGINRTSSRESFRLWIDQVKVCAGFGTVVSGTVVSGKLRRDDPVQLLPAGNVARVRSLESHGRLIERTCPGQRIGINLHKIPATAVTRGMTLVTPGTLEENYLLNVELHVLKGVSGGLKNRQRLKLHIGTSISNAMLVTMDSTTLPPGGHGLAQFRLMKPVAALPRDPFVVTLLNRNVVVGGGVILETTREKYRPAKSAGTLPVLSTLRDSDLVEYLNLIFSPRQISPLSAQELARRTGWPHLRFEAEINARVKNGSLHYIKGLGAIEKSAHHRLKEDVLRSVETIFRGDAVKKSINEKEVADRAAIGLEEPLLHALIEDLCQSRRLKKGGGGLKNPFFEECLPAGNETMARLLLEYAQKSGLSPFSADSIWKLHQKKMDKLEIQHTLELLADRKQLIRLRDNRFLQADSLEIIKERVSAAIQTKGRITLKDSQEILGYGRWGGAPVLDYLDKIGFTIRIGDERVIRQ